MTATLRRKLAEAQSNSMGQEMTALRALRLSVARAGDDLFDLALGVAAVRQQRMLPDDMSAVMSDDDLLIVLECPQGQTGAVSVSLPMVASLIQQQTMGSVSERAPDPRGFTDTDAAMCAPLIEGVLSRAADLAETDADRSCLDGIRFGARGEDVRSMLLGLRARRYRVFWLTLDIALGCHQAELVIAVPDVAGETVEPGGDAAHIADRVGQSPMLEAQAEVEAVLARFKLSVSELNGLRVGDALPLPRDRLDDTGLVTVAGQIVARGRLGQMNGNRAVRLMGPHAIPRAAPGAQAASFDPLASPASPAAAVPDPGFPTLENTPDIGAFPDAADFGTDAALDHMSPEEAAEQISALAGLSSEDLVSGTGSDLPGAGVEDAGLPATMLDLSTDDPGA